MGESKRKAGPVNPTIGTRSKAPWNLNPTSDRM